MGSFIYTAEGPEINAAAPSDLVISTNIRNGCARRNEVIIFTVNPARPPKNAAAILVTQWVNGVKYAEKTHPVDKSFPVSMSSAVPAHLAVTAVYLDAAGKAVNPPPATGGIGDGVLIEPQLLVPGRPCPPDFDVFWKKQLEKLAAIPLKYTRTPAKLPKKSAAKFRCDEVNIDSIAGIPVTGFLVMPKTAAPKSLPAVVCFHGAGFKSASKRTEFGNAIVFDVNAHGIPNGLPRSYYKQLNRTSVPGRSISIGKTDPDKNYIKNMFLRTVRAMDFVRSLPEWDGRTMIVFGRSQGGAQAIAAAALDPGVTLCIANVPALADHAGRNQMRQPGWPNYNRKNDPAVAATADYIDVVNLAGRIRCETYISAGLIDSICPPTSVWLCYQNINLTEKKHITLFPRLGHNAPPRKLDGTRIIKEELKK